MKRIQILANLSIKIIEILKQTQIKILFRIYYLPPIGTPMKLCGIRPDLWAEVAE